MPAYRDLLDTLTADLSTQSAAATALSAAQTAKAHADTDVAADSATWAASLKAAPGGCVVDASATPPVLYTSTDGLTYSTTTIAAIGDPIPSAAQPAPAPTPAPANP